MCAASVIIIIKSVETLNDDALYFSHYKDPSSTYILPNITMTLSAVIVMISAVGRIHFIIFIIVLIFFVIK